MPVIWSSDVLISRRNCWLIIPCLTHAGLHFVPFLHLHTCHLYCSVLRALWMQWKRCSSGMKTLRTPWWPRKRKSRPWMTWRTNWSKGNIPTASCKYRTLQLLLILSKLSNFSTAKQSSLFVEGLSVLIFGWDSMCSSEGSVSWKRDIMAENCLKNSPKILLFLCL